MPSNGNDRITVTPGLHDGLGGADDFYWPGGSATIVGGDTGEAYDPNIYGTKTGGDRLHVDGDISVILRLTSTEDGTATRGGEAAAGRLDLDHGANLVLADPDDAPDPCHVDIGQGSAAPLNPAGYISHLEIIDAGQ